jgi:hypothetical protein
MSKADGPDRANPDRADAPLIEGATLGVRARGVGGTNREGGTGIDVDVVAGSSVASAGCLIGVSDSVTT